MKLNPDQIKSEIDTEGYFHFKNILSKEFLDQLRNGIDQGIKMDKKNNETRGNYSFIAQNKGACFVKLLEESPLQDYVDKILGPTCILHSFNTISIEPSVGNPIQGAVHRDSPRFCRPYLLAVQILYMIDDFTNENGATHILPRSHLKEAKPSDSLFFTNSKRLIGNAGDAVLFDSMLWHAGGFNQTQKPRRAITKVFTRAFMKQQIDYTTCTDLAVLSKLSERSKRLLGFDSRVPKNIKEFMLPPDLRPYKPNQG